MIQEILVCHAIFRTIRNSQLAIHFYMTAPTWTPEQVLALAPDAASAKSGRELSQARKWLNPGYTDQVLWGELQGSGSKPLSDDHRTRHTRLPLFLS